MSKDKMVKPPYESFESPTPVAWETTNVPAEEIPENVRLLKFGLEFVGYAPVLAIEEECLPYHHYGKDESAVWRNWWNEKSEAEKEELIPELVRTRGNTIACDMYNPSTSRWEVLFE